MESNKQLLYKYAGLAFQLLASLGVATYIGYWTDEKAKLPFPLLVWVLPLIVLVGMIFKTVKDTNKK